MGDWCSRTQSTVAVGIFDRWEMTTKHDASSNIWGCFAERPSRHAIAKLEPHIEGTDGSQRSTAASSAKIWFITTKLTKAQLHRRKEMLASDICKFLSPNHFRTLIVKDQDNICGPRIGAFPKGQELLRLMKCISNSWRTACLEESRMKTAKHHVRRKPLSGWCWKVLEFQMTGCRMCDLSVEWNGFLGKRLFAEGPFSDQHQRALMIFWQSSVHFLHFPSAAQTTYQDVHVKGLLTHHRFVIWGRETRLRSLWAINSLCKIFVLPSRPTKKKWSIKFPTKSSFSKRDLVFCVCSLSALQSRCRDFAATYTANNDWNIPTDQKLISSRTAQGQNRLKQRIGNAMWLA